MAIGIEMGKDITLLGYFGIYLHEGVLTNVEALKGIDYGPKQLWDYSGWFGCSFSICSSWVLI